MRRTHVENATFLAATAVLLLAVGGSRATLAASTISDARRSKVAF